MGTTLTDRVRAARRQARRTSAPLTSPVLQRVIDDARTRRVTQARRAMTDGSPSRSAD